MQTTSQAKQQNWTQIISVGKNLYLFQALGEIQREIYEISHLYYTWPSSGGNRARSFNSLMQVEIFPNFPAN